MALLAASYDRGIKRVGKKAFRDILRESMRVTGRYWQRYFLPLHWRKSAKRRYNYTPRAGDPGSGRPFKGSYQWKKLKGFKNSEGIKSEGTTRPLAWSGRSEDTGLRGKVTPRAFSSAKASVEITIPAPALNYRPAKSRVDMRAEVTRVTADEERKLEEVLAKTADKRTEKLFKTLG